MTDLIAMNFRTSSFYAVLFAVLALLLTTCAEEPSAAPINVVEASISDVHRAILTGAMMCRMVVQSHLDRIDIYEDQINAITVPNPNALASADEIDAAVASGSDLGDLFCVPMLVKDNFDTHDMVTTGGSIALMESVPPDDAFMVRRIREEGTIVIAKTNMAEWVFSPRQSVSSSFGTTRNAYALDRVPAGSSGGTASGVAVSFGLIGLGSDTGNSIRGPSSHLALVGIRSTIGLTSRDGIIPRAFDRDIAGPMGRTGEDVARVFNVVAGYDPADPYTEDGRNRKEDDYPVFLDSSGLEGVRLGVLTQLADTEGADTAVIRVFEDAVADLMRLGAGVVDFNFDLTSARRPNMGCGRFRYDVGQYLASLGDRAPIRDVAEVFETGQYSDYKREKLAGQGKPAARHQPCGFRPSVSGLLRARGPSGLPYGTRRRDGRCRNRCRRISVLDQLTGTQRPGGLRIAGRQQSAGGSRDWPASDNCANGLYLRLLTSWTPDSGSGLCLWCALQAGLCIRAMDISPSSAEWLSRACAHGELRCDTQHGVFATIGIAPSRARIAGLSSCLHSALVPFMPATQDEQNSV